MPIAATRALLRAALDGSLDDVPVAVHPVFGLRVPSACADVDERLLDPRSTWADGSAYDAAVRQAGRPVRGELRPFRTVRRLGCAGCRHPRRRLTQGAVAEAQATLFTAWNTSRPPSQIIFTATTSTMIRPT